MESLISISLIQGNLFKSLIPIKKHNEPHRLQIILSYHLCSVFKEVHKNVSILLVSLELKILVLAYGLNFYLKAHETILRAILFHKEILHIYQATQLLIFNR